MPIITIHLLNFFSKSVLVSFFFLAPLFLLGNNFNMQEIGFLSFLYGFAPFIVSFPAGIINDRFSIKNAILISLFVIALSFSALDFINGMLITSFIFMLIGIFGAVLETSISSLYYKDMTSPDNNEKYGKFAFWIAIGATFGVITGGILIYFTSFRYLFIFYAFIFFCLIYAARNTNHIKFHTISLADYRSNLLTKRSILFLTMMFIVALHWGVESTVYSPFLRSYFKLNDFQVSLYIALPLLFLSAGAYVVEKIKFDNNLNKKLFLTGLILSGAGHILMVNQNIYLSFTSRIVHEFGDGIVNAITYLVIALMYDKKSIGGSASLLFTAMICGRITGALIFSSIGNTFGYPSTFIISGIILLIDAVFGYFLFKIEA